MPLLLLFLVILFLPSALLSLFYMGASLWADLNLPAPYVSSLKRFHEQMLQVADLKAGERLYDLGSGDGQLLILGARNFGATAVGYELGPWPYIWSKLRARWSGLPVEIRRQNFFQADLESADVVFCYLYPKLMADLEPKFTQELRPGSRVVSFAFALPNKKAEQIIPTGLPGDHQKQILLYRY
jgi:hypothetical protein